MKLSQYLEQAIANIFSAKLRSFLAVLGILVGTGSVVALVSGGKLATEEALQVFKDLGTNLLSVSLADESNAKDAKPSNTLGYTESKLMVEEISGILDVAPYTNMYEPISYQGRTLEGTIIGAEDALKRIVKINMAEGGFISFLDQTEKFAVIGHKLAQSMQQTTIGPLIGQQIWLGRDIYTIIGVMNNWPENLFFNYDVNKSVIIPIRGMNAVKPSAKITDLLFLIAPDVNIDELNANIKAYIKQHAPDLKTYEFTAKQFIESMEKQGDIYTLLLGLIGGISLLVGGIGVMNVMLVSVSERRREIGIRMAVGARRFDIQILFLIEAVVLAFIGGSIGVIVGIIISFIIAFFAEWTFHLYLLPALVGFLVSTATGIFFGYYPAYRAARLDPIETLRGD